MNVNPNPPVRPFSEAYLLVYSAEHVTYEFDMFLWSVEVCSSSSTRIRASSPEDVIRLQNVFIECFVIHLRNLIAFFYQDEPKPSDIVAADFFATTSGWHNIRPPISETLKRARTRGNKELAHLTTDRITGGPPEKKWDFGGLPDDLKPAMRLFTQNALVSRLSPTAASVIR